MTTKNKSVLVLYKSPQQVAEQIFKDLDKIPIYVIQKKNKLKDVELKDLENYKSIKKKYIGGK